MGEMIQEPFKSCHLLGIPVHTGEYGRFVDRILEWGRRRRSAYVCVANVHMTIEAHDDPEFAAIVAGADLVTPDGMPLLFALRKIHGVRQERVAGMDLIESLVEGAEREGLPIYFYGSDERTLRGMEARLRAEHPRLAIAGMHSPPFRDSTPEEKRADVEAINRSGAGLVLVALGCPKQERWMAESRGRIDAVMVGLGAAFRIYGGTSRRAPVWIRSLYLEWLYRLLQEPRRLWKRYLYSNSKFLVLLMTTLILARRDGVTGGR
jgi:N-acetylglucosaminyldiphosphoundecaprenol N-acetyl-beta-D-mannosaminyltransferase